MRVIENLSVGLWLLFSCRAAFAAPPPAAPERDFNVVLIVVDALRADHLGAYGYGRATSPNIDELAGRGILFRNVVAQSNWTLPSVASIMTSLYPSVHGAYDVPHDRAWSQKVAENRLVVSGNARLDPAALTLAEVLRRRGYLTAGFVSGSFVAPGFGIDNGFDRYLFRFATAGEMNENDVFPWLAKNRGRKFFLYLHPIEVHDPYGMYGRIRPYDLRWDPDYRGTVSGSSDVLRKIDRGELRPAPRDLAHLVALYDGGISYLDVQIGQLIKELERTGLLEKTLIVFTADHGDGFMEHGHVLHGNTAYDELLKVPLIFRFPRGAAGRKIDAQARLIDIYPTVLDWLKIPIPKGIQGESLLASISSGTAADRFAFSEPVVSARAAETLRTNDWKMILSAGRRELYDLRRDPAEKKNVAAELPEKSAELEARIVEWREANRRLASAPPAAPPTVLNPEIRRELKAAGYLP